MRTTAQKGAADQAPRLLFLVTCLFWFSQYSFASYINAELEHMGASATMMGLCGTMYGLFQIVSRLPIGWYSARMGRQKPFVIMGCALALIAVIGMYVFYSPVGFMAFRAVAGMASGTWVCFTVLYGSYFKREDASRHISLLDMGGQLGKLVCYLIILQVVAAFDVRAALVVGMLVGFGALLLSTTVAEKKLPRQKLKLSQIKKVAGNRHLLVCGLLACFAQFIQCGTALSFTQNLATRLAASNAQLTVINICQLLGCIVLNLAANKVVTPRIGAKKTVIIGFSLGTLYCVLAPLCTNLPALYAAQLLSAANTSIALSTLLGQSMRDISQKHRSIAMALFQIMFSVGIMLGPLVMGLIVDASALDIGFYAMALVSLAACALTALLYNEQAMDEAQLA